MQNYKEIVKRKWDILHLQPRFQLRYPHERVIQFLFHNFDRNQFKRLKILDHGCGGGRHVVFLAEQGIQVYGADVSKTALEFAKKILKERKIKAKLDLVKNNTLPYPDNFFDGVISFGVIYYLNLKDAQEVIKEIRRILKKDGKAFFVLRSNKDYRYERGQKVSPNTFIIKEENKNLSVSNEDGMLMHFFNLREIKRIFKDFSQLKIDKMINTYNNQETLNWDFVVICKK